MLKNARQQVQKKVQNVLGKRAVVELVHEVVLKFV